MSNGGLINEAVAPQLDVLQDPYRLAAADYQTMPRDDALYNLVQIYDTRIVFSAIALPADYLVSSISIPSIVGAVLPVNQWFALFAIDLAAPPAGYTLLGTTTDDLATPWPNNTVKTLAMSTPVTTSYSGIYYLGIMVGATTVPSLPGLNDLASPAPLYSGNPYLSGFGPNGLTTPATCPTSGSMVSNTPNRYFGYVS